MKNKTLEKMLSDMSRAGEGVESLDVENLIRQVSLGEVNSSVAAALINAKRADSNRVATPVNSFRSPVSAANFDIVITRNSANIARSLPAPIFGCLDFESSYVEIFGQLDSGVTVTVAVTSNKKGLRFTLVEGANTDTIDVQCNQIPYVNMLRGTQTSLIKMSQNKLIISDSSVQTQFSNPVYYFQRSMFGRKTSDQYTPNQYKTDVQYQNDMRVIDQIIDIDAEKSIVPLIHNTAGFSLTITTFVQKYEKPSTLGF